MSGLCNATMPGWLVICDLDAGHEGDHGGLKRADGYSHRYTWPQETAVKVCPDCGFSGWATECPRCRDNNNENPRSELVRD